MKGISSDLNNLEGYVEESNSAATKAISGNGDVLKVGDRVAYGDFDNQKNGEIIKIDGTLVTIERMEWNDEIDNDELVKYEVEDFELQLL